MVRENWCTSTQSAPSTWAKSQATGKKYPAAVAGIRAGSASGSTPAAQSEAVGSNPTRPSIGQGSRPKRLSPYRQPERRHRRDRSPGGIWGNSTSRKYNGRWPTGPKVAATMLVRIQFASPAGRIRPPWGSAFRKPLLKLTAGKDRRRVKPWPGEIRRGGPQRGLSISFSHTPHKAGSSPASRHRPKRRKLWQIFAIMIPGA